MLYSLYQIRIYTSNKKNIKYLLALFSFFFKKPVNFPKIKKTFVVVRSPHIFAKSKERFQLFQYSIIFVCTNSYFLRLFLKHLPIDCEISVLKNSFSTISVFQ